MTLTGQRSRGRTPRWLRWLGLAYLTVLVASTVFRLFQSAPPRPPDRLEVTVPEVDSEGVVENEPSVQVAYLFWRAGELHSELAQPRSDSPHSNPLILLHGSPGDAGNFRALAAGLSRDRDVYALDLPGFGGSSRDVADYSILAHARYTLEWMEALGIEHGHLAGFSMGGGVVLHVWDLAPQKVDSVTMISAIGVQDYELLGSYSLNHLLHGAQTVCIEAARWLLPHFGLLDHGMLGRSYQRNFFDTDQRPLRGILERFEPPMLIVQGRRDPLVPMEAAIEHARLVPQSQLVMREDSHFFVFDGSSGLIETMSDFLGEVDRDSAPRRAQANQERVIAARAPLDLATLPRWSGPSLLTVLLLIALATLISEDFTLIGTGLLVAQGRVEFLPAASAAFAGIVAGDMMLFWVGRLFGRRMIRQRPFSWWISAQAIRESSLWLRRRGIVVVLITRVLPGTRLPTNIAAGLLRTSGWRFLAYFTLAGLFWTYPVVWLCSRLGTRFLPRLHEWRWQLLGVVIAIGVAQWLLRKFLLPLSSWRGRRLLVGRWRRLTHWEFWPSFMIYAPLTPYLVWLAIKHRSATTFTAANPGIPAGGFVGESKSEILAALPAEVVPRWVTVPSESEGLNRHQRLALLKEFFPQQPPSWPIVVKPDVGERGQGVVIARSWADVANRLRLERRTLIGQEFVAGEEFSVFWMRRPSQPRGFVFSITIKKPATVVGDGRRSLYDLILADDRAVALVERYLEERPDARERIPLAGEAVPISKVGSHSRGTIFEDGAHLISDDLEAAIGAIAESFARSDGKPGSGFDFGRFDLITDDQESLRRGENLRILEANGVTSESTNMYDRRHSLLAGLGILARQWRVCFEIGAERREQGFTPASWRRLLGDWRRSRQSPR